MLKRLSLIILAILLFGLNGYSQNLSDLLADATKIGCFTTDEINLSKLLSIYSLDVFSYYKIENYNTELKIKHFKETEEFKELVEELKTLKKEMISKTFFKYMGGVTSYDLKRKRFQYLAFGSGDDFLYFPALPNWKNRICVNESWMFIPMVDEKKALEVENNTENISVYFIFKLPELKKIYSNSVITRKVLIAPTVRVVMANDSTDVIYYDKTFTQKNK